MVTRKKAPRRENKDTTIPMSNHIETDSELRRESDTRPLEPDDLMKQRAAREAARIKRDEYLVETDLEDADERFPLPNMKEQE